MRRSLLALALAALLTSPAAAQITPFPAGPTNQSNLALIAPTPASPTENSNRIATTQWVNNFVGAGLPGILFTNIAAPAAPAAGTALIYVDSTTKTLSAKNDAGTVSNTVVASLAVANQFMTGISAAGVITRAQPNFTDLAGQGSCAQEPAMTGDVTSSAGSCALAIGTNKVTRAMEAQGVARSVIGVAGNATANVADIQGTTANTFLGVNAAGNGLAFAVPALSSLTNSLVADVVLNNTGTFFDGPSVAQGSTGTWFVSGTVTCVDTVGAGAFIAKLWDGTTVIASTVINTSAANFRGVVSLSGVLTSPAGNLRISVESTASTSGLIKFNSSGLSKDSTITAVRIN